VRERAAATRRAAGGVACDGGGRVRSPSARSRAG
jgi:hypothetical protein